MFQFQYKLTKKYQILYFALLGLCLFFTIARWYSVVDPNYYFLSPEIHSHLSNFSLSMIIYLGIGYSWLLYGVPFKKIQYFGIVLLVANIICETLVTVMNTPDIWDAVFGCVATMLVYMYLYSANKRGLVALV